MSRKERHYTWFVYPHNSHSNEVIAREASERRFTIDEIRDASCADGKERNLWRCEADFARYLFASQDTLGIECSFFNREGNGQIRQVPPWVFKKKRRKTKTPKKSVMMK